MIKPDRQAPAAPRLEHERRIYSPPTLVEYGSVAKLTQSGGSTSNEGTIVAKMAMCL